ncbi:hypothetical protein [Psychrobacter celer]|uniref:hypothetical protein n=2 Tax=Psychrobacter TaxID=497 RepID=UPI0018DFCBC2|nr:hypothetical protein [Psychrobacter celer]
MTTDNSSTDKNEPDEEQEIDRNIDIVALKKIITTLQARTNSLAVAIEKILSVPTNLNIAESMLQHSTCSDSEKNNNIIFLGDIEQKTISYCDNNFNFDLEAFENYSLPSEYLDECIATGENKLTYLLNRYTEDVLSKLFSDFVNNPENYALFRATISSFQESEIDRLNSNVESIVEVYLYKTISILAYRLDVYDVALMYHDFLMTTYSGGIIEVSYDSGSYFKSEISKKNIKAANAGAKDKRLFRQRKKKQYLQIMEEKSFTSYAKTAEYIKLNIDTDESPTYRTVEKWLSEADKGDFS